MCLAHADADSGTSRQPEADVREQIFALLADKRPHAISDLYTIDCPTEDIEQVLQCLIDEETIINDDGSLSLA